ncbi:hypothetical protein BO99DRAFT_468514 [Aspergillus violaceofuscus CBS 115571]|uniref:AttH domain-containing protein n=1 Tax=Aspergillus violaceofuscus (strain CBS 115571) TaxID=1450538 RepID=A0A2V5HG62_ASPV1|nr:hypothetical protein BO99DRAFT_468514 [Aspergillus violaceofuscus CBS 115571]
MHSTAMKLTAFASVLTTALGFRAEMGGLQEQAISAPLPLMIDPASSQSFIANISNSWWSSSYIRASNEHDYMILSHAGLSPSRGYYRASILDITDPTVYHQFETILDPSESSAYEVPDVPFNFTLDQYGFQSVDAAKPLGSMRTWSSIEDVEFDVTFDLSAPVLLNGGSGSFPWGSQVTYEWSMPSGLTSGSLVVNGTRLSIDPVRSMTWYDRQITWPQGLTTLPSNTNWTWFELHLNNDLGEQSEKLSIWIYDSGDSERHQFATVRKAPGVNTVLPVTEFTQSDRTWTSTTSNATYPLDWVVTMSDGTSLSISSVREDQELCDEDGVAPTYEGYITVNGFDRAGNKISGFGVVEVVPVIAA